MNYNTFISGLKKAGIDINRQMLADLAVADAKSFADLVSVAKSQSSL